MTNGNVGFIIIEAHIVRVFVAYSNDAFFAAFDTAKRYRWVSQTGAVIVNKSNVVDCIVADLVWREANFPAGVSLIDIFSGRIFIVFLIKKGGDIYGIAVRRGESNHNINDAWVKRIDVVV